ncbi:MAG: hypothetical protein M1828_003570 [Chrysothrix sp. TS-e1954]|nr:MAG: hypothetical protein M1828_003570 [Chrysothrix sp. TS-e1954]
MARPYPLKTSTRPQISLIYTLFFLYIEPITALLGAYYAYNHPTLYLLSTTSAIPNTPSLLSLTTASTLPLPPTATHITLRQLANLYLLFALNEAVVLRSTRDLAVWRTLLFGLLVADLGHLWSLAPLGGRAYWDVGGWGEMDWGNRGVVYAGMGLRGAFLGGWGVGG